MRLSPFSSLSLLTADEADYYRFPMPVPGPPPEKCILVSRIPHTQSVKITYPTGETKIFSQTPNIHNELVEAGLPRAKLIRVLDYVWNFYHCIVFVG